MEIQDSYKESQTEPKDNRVIADMNIEGMPWYVKNKTLNSENREPISPLTRRELFRLTFSAMAAALAVGLIFISVFFLFIMFCIKIWF